MYGVLTHISPRFVDKLGVLDRLFITPSVHRVHHGKDLSYLDRNYGVVFLVWDHLFRTFRAEDKAPTYGVLADMDAGSLSDVHLSPWISLARDVRRAPGIVQKLRVIFYAPGYNPNGSDQRVRVLRALRDSG
jgi:hypothetical protein